MTEGTDINISRPDKKKKKSLYSSWLMSKVMMHAIAPENQLLGAEPCTNLVLQAIYIGSDIRVLIYWKFLIINLIQKK